MGDPAVERAVQLELLSAAVDMDDFDGQLTALHALCDAELASGAPGRARGWLAEADRLLADGRGGVQIRARHAEARRRVEAEGPGPVEAVEMPAPLPPMTAAELERMRADLERKQEALDVRRTQVEAEIALQRARVEALEGGAAPPPPKPAAPTPASGSPLMVDQPLAALPAAFAYALEDGPPIPAHVRYVVGRWDYRTTGIGTWVGLGVLAVLTVFSVVTGVGALDHGSTFNAAVAFGLVALWVALGGLALWRLRASRADDRRIAAGTYRLGLYFDGDALLWRSEGGFSLYPRDRVEPARLETKYNSEMKTSTTSVVFVWRDERGGRVERVLDDQKYPMSVSALVELIERWRAGKRLGV